VFRNPNFATFHKDRNSISGRFSIFPASTDKDYDKSAMGYIEALEEDPSSAVFEGYPAEVNFTYFLPPNVFADVLANIRSGITPSSITIELEPPDESDVDFEARVLKYSWEPDGSGRIWNNEKSNIKIGSYLRLEFDKLEKAFDDEEGEYRTPKPSNAQLIKQNQELKEGLESIHKALLYYGGPLTFMVFVIAVIMFYWATQHMG
jgi:hypothetical protein